MGSVCKGQLRMRSLSTRYRDVVCLPFCCSSEPYTQSIEWTVKHMAFISKSTLSRWLRGFFQWGYYIWLKKCWCYTSCLYLLYKVSSFNITGRCPSQVTEYVYSPLYLFFRIEKHLSSLHSLKMLHKSNCNRYWCWAFFFWTHSSAETSFHIPGVM